MGETLRNNGIMKGKLRMFEHAKNMSLMSNFHKGHTGCVVAFKNIVVSAGFNSTKTHPVQMKYNTERFSVDTPHCLHAEVHALSHIMNNDSIDWGRIHIYTYRETKNGVRALSRPCKSCMKLIKDLGIKHIHYTTEDGYAYEQIG